MTKAGTFAGPSEGKMKSCQLFSSDFARSTPSSRTLRTRAVERGIGLLNFSDPALHDHAHCPDLFGADWCVYFLVSELTIGVVSSHAQVPILRKRGLLW